MLRIIIIILLINTAVYSCKRKEECIRSAINMELHKSTVWLYLLHYKDGRSEIDDPYFFLSPFGMTDPEAELKSTIDLLFNKPNEICRFPARAYFLHLKTNMPFNIDKCVNLKMFLKYLEGNDVHLIYVEQYPYSMPSLFGHLFLKIDSPSCKIINYTADVDQEGLLHPFKGLFGYYKGYFSVIPCEEGIEKYVKIHKRKMYTKHLPMNEEELMLMKLHIWELLHIKPSYYFTHRNCASETYHLVSFKYPLKHPKVFKAPTDIFGEMRSRPSIHRSGKVSIIYSADRKAYINIRPLYHDILDKPTGFRRGYEAIVSEFEVSYSFTEEKLSFNRWTVVRGSYLSNYRDNPSLSFEVSLIKKDDKSYYLYGNIGTGISLYIKKLTLFTLFFGELYENILEGYISPGLLFQGDRLSFLIKGDLGRIKRRFYAGIDIHPDSRYSIRIENTGGILRLGTGFFF